MASGASSSGVPVTTTSSTGSTILSNAQAAQLLHKIRALNASGSGSTPQTIKIQAIQTNPQTGVRQIVAIPIQSAVASQSGVRSPMKVIRLPSALATTGQVVTAETTEGVSSGVKVVKLPARVVGATGVKRELPASTPIAVRPAVPSHQKNQGEVTAMIAASDAVPPENDESSPVCTPFNGGSVGSRKRSDIDFDSFNDSKRRKTEKGGKGLRHFSMKVCEKVQAKGTTSYNEVADELVTELTDPRCTSPTDQQYDQKNIRRRVYDALNVLMAMNIISKEKKEIRWLGLPTNYVQEANGLEVDKAKRIERIKRKTQQLQDLILQQIAFKNLVERNKEREKTDGVPHPNTTVQLPFIIVNTSKKTVIEVSISHDKTEYLFNFDDTFEIHDDMEVLKRMGLSFGLERGSVKPEDLEKARKMVPRALEQYVDQLAKNGPGVCVGLPSPKVSTSKLLHEKAPSSFGHMGGESSYVDVGQFDQEESDSEVDIS